MRTACVRPEPVSSRPVPMFSRVASLLALLPMLFHSVLGCCWHHEHGSVCDSGSIRVVCQSGIESSGDVHADHSLACASHDHESGAAIPHEHPGEPCPDAPCDGERCQFTGTSVGVVSQLDLLVNLASGLFVVSAELPVRRPLLLATSRNLDDGPGSHSAGERRALMQVWLI